MAAEGQIDEQRALGRVRSTAAESRTEGAALEAIDAQDAFNSEAPEGLIKEIDERVTFLNNPKNRAIVSKMGTAKRELKDAILKYTVGDLLEAGGTIKFNDGDIAIGHSTYAARDATDEKHITRVSVKARAGA